MARARRRPRRHGGRARVAPQDGSWPRRCGCRQRRRLPRYSGHRRRDAGGLLRVQHALRHAGARARARRAAARTRSSSARPARHGCRPRGRDGPHDPPLVHRQGRSRHDRAHGHRPSGRARSMAADSPHRVRSHRRGGCGDRRLCLVARGAELPAAPLHGWGYRLRSADRADCRRAPRRPRSTCRGVRLLRELPVLRAGAFEHRRLSRDPVGPPLLPVPDVWRLASCAACRSVRLRRHRTRGRRLSASRGRMDAGGPRRHRASGLSARDAVARRTVELAALPPRPRPRPQCPRSLSRRPTRAVP